MIRAHRNQLNYPELWKAVDGAVRDAAINHPDIQIPDKRRSSIVKRVVGAVLALQGVGAGKPAETAERPPKAPATIGAYLAGVEGLAEFGGQPHQQPTGKGET